MKNWYSHLIVGLVIAIIFVILLKDLRATELSAIVLAIGFGSLVPDIDHPTSKIRNGLRIFLVLGAIALVYVLITTTVIGLLILSYISNQWQIWAISIIIGMLLAYMLDRLIPAHRGKVHGILAAIAYATLCYLVAVVLFLENPQIIAFGGLIGYISHTVTDKL